MNNQRALFYPLLREAVPVIRYRQMVYPSWQLDIVAAVSPPAYLAEGKDAAFLDVTEKYLLDNKTPRTLSQLFFLLFSKILCGIFRTEKGSGFS